MNGGRRQTAARVHSRHGKAAARPSGPQRVTWQLGRQRETRGSDRDVEPLAVDGRHRIGTVLGTGMSSERWTATTVVRVESWHPAHSSGLQRVSWRPDRQREAQGSDRNVKPHAGMIGQHVCENACGPVSEVIDVQISRSLVAG